jgi:protein-S-isoprenylcysteine O-methyltransferase Ste14
MAQTTQGHAGVIAPPPLLYAVPLGLGLLLERVSPAPFLPRPVARLFGGMLVAGATAVEAWFIRTMRRAATPIDPRKPVVRLVTAGPFRFSRNPSYLALAAYYVGISSLVNTRWPLLLLPAVLLGVQRGVIEREEQYLERRFGDEYRGYRARVRRWL